MHATLDHFWQTILKPLFEAAGVLSILEIGAASGRNTQNLIAYARERNGMVCAVDPSPQFDVFEWRIAHSDCFRFFEETSLHALSHLRDRFDAVLIDGDHNWYTVFHELQLLESRIAPFDAFPLTILHDVGWPYARRDQYCNPDSIPQAYRHPYERKGIVPGQNNLHLEHGMNRNHWNANEEHSIRNGVLTAVEDFMLQSKRSFLWVELPGFFGLGLLVEKSLMEAKPLLASFLPQLELTDPIRKHLQLLEKDRISIGIEALDARREADRVYRESLADQQAAEEKLKREWSKLHMQEYQKVQQEKDHLRSQLHLSQFVCHSLKKELSLLEGELLRLQLSKSWKLTRFLRVLEPKIRKILPKKLQHPPAVPRQQAVKEGSSSLSALPQKSLVFCTIISRNFLAYARVLASSLRRHHPDAELVVLLIDALGDGFDALHEPFTVIPVSDIPLPNRHSFCFRYGIRELHTAVKPFFLQWLFEHRAEERVVYLDPDILVQSTLHVMTEALSKHPIVLTPHVLTPIQDGLRPSEHDVLRVGVFNLGFIGLARNDLTLRFLHWWQQKVTEDCTEEPDRNVFFDQRWMDLAPVLFPGVHVIRDASYNVAYWNLHERTVLRENGVWVVNGAPLTFFHFSGFRPDVPDRICKYDHSDRSLEKYPALRPLLHEYADLLLAAGWQETRSMPYLFSCFQNGVRIPAFARRYVHMLAAYQRARFGNPFAVGPGSYWEWLQSRHTLATSGITLTNAQFLLWQSNPVFMRQFPRFHEQWAEWLASKENRVQLPDVAEEFFASLECVRAPEHRPFLQTIVARRNSFRWYRVCTECARRLLPRDVFASIRTLLSMRDLLPRDRRKSVRVSRPVGINIVGALMSGTGVGQAARLHVSAADAVGIPLTLHHLESPFFGRMQTELQSRFTSEYAFGTTLLHMNADRVSFFLQNEGSAPLLSYRSIGYWVWELSRFPRQYRHAAKWFDEIWTPSRFSADAISKMVDCPVHVVPHPVQIAGIQTIGRDFFGIRNDAFVFLFIFNAQSVTERKNPAAVIEAFMRAFSPDEPAQLVIKFMDAGDDPSIRERLSEQADGHNVLLIDSFLTMEQTHDLIRCCDAYVSLHRSEGFGLTIAEAMALGKPVIATNYSGNAEYMTEQNSMPIGYKLIPLDGPYPPYRSGNVWADPDIAEAAAAMRRLFDDRSFGISLGTRAAADIRKTHAPEVIGKLMKDRLMSE